MTMENSKCPGLRSCKPLIEDRHGGRCPNTTQGPWGGGGKPCALGSKRPGLKSDLTKYSFNTVHVKLAKLLHFSAAGYLVSMSGLRRHLPPEFSENRAGSVRTQQNRCPLWKFKAKGDVCNSAVMGWLLNTICPVTTMIFPLH